MAIYQFEICTPVPKTDPPETMDKMRNISGLLTSDNKFEKLLAEILIYDIKKKADTSQFGKEKQTSIQHYPNKMIHRIQTALDRNSRINMFAVVASLIDWNSAFVRQCPKLGINHFRKME